MTQSKRAYQPEGQMELMCLDYIVWLLLRRCSRTNMITRSEKPLAMQQELLLVVHLLSPSAMPDLRLTRRAQTSLASDRTDAHRSKHYPTGRKATRRTVSSADGGSSSIHTLCGDYVGHPQLRRDI